MRRMPHTPQGEGDEATKQMRRYRRPRHARLFASEDSVRSNHEREDH